MVHVTLNFINAAKQRMNLTCLESETTQLTCLLKKKGGKINKQKCNLFENKI